MPQVTKFQWQCPSCNELLSLNAKVWRCDNGHTFDCAKQGYVNLLLAQQKNSKAPGDSKEMVVARQQFLAQGHYRPLADKIGAIVADFVNNKTPLSLLDAGCGEGYYTEQVLDKLVQQGVSVIASGIDISKPAIIKAAKSKKNIQFAVASTYQIPLASESQDAAIQVFAPSSETEIHRILKAEGIWVTVNPAEDHLFELKELVYDKPAKHDNHVQNPGGFNRVSEFRSRFEVKLCNQQQRENLLMMTPFYWSISADKKRQVLEMLGSVTTDFTISVYRKA
jgi:23S rRNA (guanine745-N1)-methyltransferase